MINKNIATEQSSLPKLEPVKIIHDYESIVDKAIVKACSERVFEHIFDYEEALVSFLRENYSEYKVKVIYQNDWRDGSFPIGIKLSWYPKQEVKVKQAAS